MSESHPSPLTLQELPELRRKTEAISQLLRHQIVGHFETLRPLLAPERIFGKLAGGKTEVPGSDLALEELQQNYRQFTQQTVRSPGRFQYQLADARRQRAGAARLGICPHIQGKSITMSSPVRWVVNYRSNLDLAHVKNILTGKETPRLDYLRQFVVNALVFQILLARTPGLAPLFADLRYELKTENARRARRSARW